MAGFEGLEKVQRNLAAVVRGIQGRTAQGVTKAAYFVAREALPRTPIDKGFLRNSQVVSDGMIGDEPVAAVAYQISYAPFVHENLEARHPVGEAKFLERTVNENESEILAIIARNAKVG